MTYAIIDGTTVKSTGTIQRLFPNTSFPSLGVPASFFTDNNVVEVVDSLSYTLPTETLVTKDAFVKDGKVYTCEVITASDELKATAIANKWGEIRTNRNNKLAETDWKASSDLTLSNDWKTYRQALRDITTQSDPFNITWPTAPSS